ncbi:MAG: class I SAM-dependent methyltransferase [Gammaproteobacteria bacterium]|nr:class I SAM-dependent methyltransferase [Gammaproteobacteria bacterium]
MSCCCPHARSASRIFSFFARRYRRRFEKKGFEPSQKQLMAGLSEAGFAGKTLLEIGSGVGHLHQTLLEQGAGSAVGVDLAPRMIDEARRWARERQLESRVTYLEGDFINLADALEPADITVLDKVVCCYPDAEGLVKQSLRKTKGVYALTYPRNRWYVWLGGQAQALIMALIRSDFRAYVHDPEQVERWISAAGFRKVYQATTVIWLTQVYTKV